MKQPRTTVGPNDRWGQRLHHGQTSQTVVVRETREDKRMMFWSGSSPVWCTPVRIAATLSDMSDCLSLLSSRSMSFCIDGMV
jgi:hypothetical protein